jgi:hypothetical protein
MSDGASYSSPETCAPLVEAFVLDYALSVWSWRHRFHGFFSAFAPQMRYLSEKLEYPKRSQRTRVAPCNYVSNG